MRTKSLRERFGSKRSYSENFKDPPETATTSPSKEGCRTVRPLVPIIGVPTIPTDESKDPQKIYNPYAQSQNLLQQQQKRQMNVLVNTTIHSLFCRKLTAVPWTLIARKDPRFPWQRDAAVQCDLSPDPDGLRFTRRDSFFMMAKDAAEQKERKPSFSAITEKFPTSLASLTATLTTTLPSGLTSYPTGLTDIPSGLREEQSGQFLAEKFKEAYWHNLSICTEEDETTVAPEYPEPFKKERKKKKTSMLQRALSERTRSRRLTYQTTSTDEGRPSGLSPQRYPHLSNNSEGTPEYRHLPNPPAEVPPAPTVNCSSAPTSRTETPPSDASPQTPPAAASGSSPSRRNSDRRKRGFVRKNTQSAPDSFDNDDDSYTGVPTITQTSVDPIDGPNKRPEGLSIGYFNFDSMQRLLDLSITASTKPEKPSFLLTPGGKICNRNTHCKRYKVVLSWHNVVPAHFGGRETRGPKA
ncbi:uncharacterized protein TNCT_431951 [Trichonephila clavata]|uniref:Uncharacterized protein n=2 Tax=Trichonephila TaxID=2585208 RepID=A0A8X6IFF6_TRICU|nr:uncharacterized protein TNCT_431951 [Trichonephila clavata]